MRFFDYALNIVCVPFTQPIAVHVFLGPVPNGLSYEQHSSIPSWVGQQFITPRRPFMKGAEARGYGDSAGIANVKANDQPNLRTAANMDTSTMPQSLPDNYFNGAVRHSIRLTEPLIERLQDHGINPASPAMRTFLAKNLQWRIVSRFDNDLDDVRYRVWVTETEIKKPPEREPPEVVWAATLGKRGGLQRGELPQME